MNMIKNPLTLSAAALALFLAGCGGSDDPVVTPDPDTGSPKVPDTDTSTTDVSAALVNATAELNTLAGGAGAEGSALKMAMDADEKATALDAKGVSMQVQTYAQKVLTAAMDLEDAITEAKAVRTRVQSAHDALSAGAAKTALKNLIDRADMVIKAGEARRDAIGSSTLRALVIKYTGEGKTPADLATAKAKGLFDSDSAFPNTFAPASNGVFGTAPTDAQRKVIFANGNARTANMHKFTDLFTTQKIPLDNANVDAVAVETDDQNIGGSPTLTGTDPVAGTYNGISGMFHNRPEDDEAKWFFAPLEANRDSYWQLNPAGTAYVQAAYLEWGLWLTDETTVAHYVGQGEGSAAVPTRDVGSITGVVGTDEDEVTARYSGDAVGLSARRTGGTDAAPVYASGHFAAKMNLTATFKETGDQLDGEITDFQPTGTGTDHVDTSWRLNLVGSEFTGAASGGFENPQAESNPVSGEWRAQAYGGGTEEPAGIYGGFAAHFGEDAKNGKVHGVYHTTKQ